MNINMAKRVKRSEYFYASGRNDRFVHDVSIWGQNICYSCINKLHMIGCFAIYECADILIFHAR